MLCYSCLGAAKEEDEDEDEEKEKERGVQRRREERCKQGGLWRQVDLSVIDGELRK
jgi:hypothetical protein